jgi:hypothetical protein
VFTVPVVFVEVFNNILASTVRKSASGTHDDHGKIAAGL